MFSYQKLNPNQPGLFWRLSLDSGGGGAASPSPFTDLGRGSRDRRENMHKGIECDVNYKTVLLDYSLLLSVILYELIMLIYAPQNILFSL